MRPHHLKNLKYYIIDDQTLLPRELWLLLTGTPLQNSNEELWELLFFSKSDTFESKEALVENFGQLTDANQISDLCPKLLSGIL